MKATLQPGVSLTRQIVVDRPRTIEFMGEDGRVYGTPYMILDIEETCRLLIVQHADPGEDSVGIEVNVKHLAATLPNMTVEITVIQRLSTMPSVISVQRLTKSGGKNAAIKRAPRGRPSQTRAQFTSVVPSASAR